MVDSSYYIALAIDLFTSFASNKNVTVCIAVRQFYLCI